MNRPSQPSRKYDVERWSDGLPAPSDDDELTVEEPLEIRIGGESVAVTMRTPGHDEELAAGFCVTEGIVADADDIARVAICDEAADDNVVDVTLDRGALRPEAVARAQRATYLSSSCGICGKQSLDRIEQMARPLRPGEPTISASQLAGLPAKMRRPQTVFSKTGGLHSAAVFDRGGNLTVLREDIGRHNAVDKVIGHCLLQRRSADDAAVLLVSGRASFEVLQKAALARIPIIAAVSALVKQRSPRAHPKQVRQTIKEMCEPLLAASRTKKR